MSNSPTLKEVKHRVIDAIEAYNSLPNITFYPDVDTNSITEDPLTGTITMLLTSMDEVSDYKTLIETIELYLRGWTFVLSSGIHPRDGTKFTTLKVRLPKIPKPLEVAAPGCKPSSTGLRSCLCGCTAAFLAMFLLLAAVMIKFYADSLKGRSLSSLFFDNWRHGY